MKKFRENKHCESPGAKLVLPHLDRFLKKEGFVILARNDCDPSKGGQFEAWAYRGSLDFQTAKPVTFGIGVSVPDAIDALELLLDNSCKVNSAGLSDEQPVRRGGKKGEYS